MSKRLNLLAPVAAAVMAVALAAAPVAAFAGDAVATCDGKEYSTLQAAIDAAGSDADNPSSVVLLKDTKEQLTIASKSLSIDLGSHVVSWYGGSVLEADEKGPGLTVSGGSHVSLENGSFVTTGDADSIKVDGGDEEPVVELKDVSCSAESSIYCTIRMNAGTMRIEGGTFSSILPAVYVNGSSSFTASDASFSLSNTELFSGPSLCVAGTATMTIEGGTVSTYVEDSDSSTLSVSGGSFGEPTNAGSVVDGKSFLKRRGGSYEVVETSAAVSACAASVSKDGNVIYFESPDEAKAYADDESGSALTTYAAKLNGVCYATLQAAIDASTSSSDVVEVISDVAEQVTVDGKSLTIDLGGRTLSVDDSGAKAALTVTGSGKVTVKDGGVYSAGTCAILSGKDGSATSLTLSNVNVNADMLALRVEGGSVSVNGGTFKGYNGFYIKDATATFNKASFTHTNQDDDETGTVYQSSAETCLTVKSGSLDGSVYCRRLDGGTNVDDPTVLSIEGGSFGSYKNLPSVASGKTLIKRDGGSYEVVSDDDALAQAGAALIEAGDAGKTYYFESYAEAEAAKAEEDLSSCTLTAIYDVTFTSDGLSADVTRRVLAVNGVGELPDAGTVSGKEFDGWYVGETKVDAAYVPAADTTVTASWSDIPFVAVATCDGVEYPSLQAAIDAASEDPRNSSKVVLKADVLNEEYAETGAITITDKCFSLDLNGHTIGNENLWVYGAVRLAGKSNVSISNGSISCFYDCIETMDGFAGTISLSDVDVTSSNYAPLALSSGSANVKSGAYSSGAYAAAEISGSAVVEIEGGTFESAEEDDFDWSDWNTVMCSGSCCLTVTGGDFTKCVELDEDDGDGVTLSITGGKFGTPDDAQYLTSEYALLKRADGKYEVVSADDAFAGAGAALIDTSDGGPTYYFESYAEAETAQEDEGLSFCTLTGIYDVTFRSAGLSADVTRRVFAVNGVGALPDAGTVSGKNFAGWYAGDSKIDAAYVPTADTTAVASWSEASVEGVATCDGVKYETLQDAINAASADPARPSVVTLLKDADEAVTISGKALALDLGGHELSNDSASVLLIGGSSQVEVKNGTVATNNARNYAVEITDAETVTFNDVNVANNGNGYRAGAALYADDGGSSLVINGGTYTADADCIVLAANGSATINDGTFINRSDGDVSSLSDVVAALGCKLTVNGGDFSICGAATLGASIEVNGGAFGTPYNAESLSAGKALYKHAGGKYEVVSEADAADACWAYVTNEYGNKIYYENRAEAKAYADLYSSKRTVTNIWKVTLESRKQAVETRRVTEGSSVGELPAGEEVAGYTFSGWYDVSTKVDESYEPAGDVTLVAMWVKDAAPDEGGDSDEPTDDPGKDDKGDEGDKGGSDSDEDGKSDDSDKAMPQTGDVASAEALVAASGAALAALGLRRRK